MTPEILTDRLYGISYRPQELAMYGQQVRFEVRSGPVFDDPAEVTDTHYRLFVLEITADLPADDDLARTQGQTLSLLKCGWELTLRTATPVAVASVDAPAGEASLLLGRIAETVNDLARKAGLDEPMGADVVTRLVQDYRRNATS